MDGWLSGRIFHNRGVGRWSSWCGIFVGEDGVSPLSSKLRAFLEYVHLKRYLGGGFKYFLFSPLFGKIPILTNIFQMG